jgi:type I restriction enzyme M protein
MLAFYREYPTEIVQDPLEQLPSPEKAPQPVAQLPDSLLWSVPWAHHSTPIPACLWFHARDRRGHVLFIDARKLGRMVDRTHRELTDEDISRTANTYHAWRGERDAGDYAEVPGFCKSAPLEEIQEHGHVLTPCRCVAAEAQEDDGEPFEEKMKRLTSQLIEQMTEGRKQDKVIEKDLKGLGFWEKGE